MALTYLKESEGAYPNRLVTGHFPLGSLMAPRKYNMRANFTPAGTTSPSLDQSTPPPPRTLGAGKPPLISSFESSNHRHIQQPLALSRTTSAPIYSSSPGYASHGTSYFPSETRKQCACPSRRLEVLNLAASQFSLFAEVLGTLGNLEQEPQFNSENKLYLQFYDLRSAQRLSEILSTISSLSGVVLQYVALDSDVSVLIDIPWGHNVKSDSLLGPLEQYGSVASLKYGTSLIGGPQQVIVVYNDVRDATKTLNNMITVDGIQLPIRPMSIPHSHVCPATASNSRKQPSFTGIGLGAIDSPPLSSAFTSSVNPMSPMSSPYSTARSDIPTSYFSSTDGSWLGSSSDMESHKIHPDHSLQRMSNRSIHVGHSRHISQSELDTGVDQRSGPLASGVMAPGTMTGSMTPGPISILDPVGSDVFRGSYGPIGRPSTESRFDSLLNNGAFGSSSKHEPLHQMHHSGLAQHQLPTALDVASKASSPIKTNDAHVSHSSVQEADKCIGILKKFANSEANLESKVEPKVEPKESKYAAGGNDIDLEAIASGVENRTTVMLRNIPNKLDFKDLKRFLDATNRCTYDFLYLRFDFMNRCNVGYAFISFTKPKHVATFVKARAGRKWSQYNYNSEKVIEIKFARIQGRDSLIQKFRNSPVMSQDPAFKPRLYYTKGKLSGKEEPFPEPTCKQSGN